MGDSYARAIARVSVAQIARNAHDEMHGGPGFKMIERSACESLLDVVSRFVRSVGAVSAQAAQHASRSEVNANDVLRGLRSVGAAPVPELLEFLHTEPDMPFPHNVASFPAATPKPDPAEGGGSNVGPVAVGAREGSKKRAAEPRPAHVPDFFPPFPEPCTYRRTTTLNKRALDPQQARKQRAKYKRQAQESLLGLQQGASGAVDGAAAVEALLPSLRSEPTAGLLGQPGAEEMLEGDDDAPGVSAGALRVPDVLAPGMPAVLQSSAASECCGVQAASAVPARSREGDAAPGAANLGASGASAARRTKHEAILGLQHMHDLEEVEAERHGGDGPAVGDDEME